MAESRLFRILYLLLEKGSTTAPELARLFEVSVRTIYRDIERLSMARIPLYSIPGKAGGIFLMKDFVLEFIFFETEKIRVWDKKILILGILYYKFLKSID